MKVYVVIKDYKYFDDYTIVRITSKEQIAKHICNNADVSVDESMRYEEFEVCDDNI